VEDAAEIHVLFGRFIYLNVTAKEIQMKSRALKATAILPLLVFLFAYAAHAELAQSGPVGASGFPQWYRDLPATNPNSTQLQLCLDPTFCKFSRPVPGNAASRGAGFGTAWYWQLDAKVGPANNPFGQFDAGVRATFAGSTATRTQRRVINHIRIDLRKLPVNGVYKVIHPFGVNTFRVLPDDFGNRDVDFVQQVGGARFNAALSGPVGPFVRARNAPAGFILNNDTLQTITGARAPGKNFFRIIGPANANLGGPAGQRNVITQTRFGGMGRLQ
jgi:hypothetical protein